MDVSWSTRRCGEDASHVYHRRRSLGVAWCRCYQLMVGCIWTMHHCSGCEHTQCHHCQFNKARSFHVCLRDSDFVKRQCAPHFAIGKIELLDTWYGYFEWIDCKVRGEAYILGGWGNPTSVEGSKSVTASISDFRSTAGIFCSQWLHCSFASRIDPVRLTRLPLPGERRHAVV